MANAQEMNTAMVNRSIRTIKAELEYLTDVAVITPQKLQELLSAIPEQTLLHAPVSVGAVPTLPSVMDAPPVQNLSLSEKHDYGRSSPVPAPPPAYAGPPSLPLAEAVAMFEYRGDDAGDLYLQPNDRVAVIEYTNSEWWKGRSLRTGQEGIFPSSYVRVVEQKMPPAPPTNNYFNNMTPAGFVNTSPNPAPVPGEQHQPSKTSEMGKKFGKKLGNATIFGAGATLGSNIVNSIL